MGYKGEVFRTTQKGYEIADSIRAGGGGNPSDQKPLAIWEKFEQRFAGTSAKGLHATYNKSSRNPWVLAGANETVQKDFKGLAELASDQLMKNPPVAALLSQEALSATGMDRWLYFLWQEGAFKKDASEVMYPSDDLPALGAIEDASEASSRLCLRLQLPDSPQYTARDWLDIGKEIAAVNEAMAWVFWTKRPKATGIRKWDITGEQSQKLRVLLERAGQMLKRSGINNDLPLRLLLENDPLKRWCEYISGGGELRSDGEGYETINGVPVEHISGRLLNAVEKSEQKCSAIVVKLT